MIVEKTASGGDAASEKAAESSANDQKTVDAAMSHHRELMALAKKKGQLKKDGTMDKAWLERMAQGDGADASRARLSITLMEMQAIKSDGSDKGAA